MYGLGDNRADIKKDAKDKQGEFFYLYMFFASGAVITYQSYEGLGLSTFITLSVALQFFAYTLLALKVVHQQSVRGISGKALQCHAVVYCSRLSSTTWLKGYIPSDGTGDGLYQLLDVMSLVTVLSLLYFIFKKHRHTYQRDQDSFEIGYLLTTCFVLAVVFHPHFNDRPVFDTLWTFALFVDVFAMMPQLWMVSKLGGADGDRLEAMNAHYIAAIAASRAVSFAFWYNGYVEFEPPEGGFNYPGYAVMSACIIQMLLLADFVFLYVKACFVGCVTAVQTGNYTHGICGMNGLSGTVDL